MQGRLDRAGAPLLLIAAVVAAYANSFLGIFQFDDYNVIVHYPGVQSFAGWADEQPSIRSLLKFSYMLNHVSGFGLAGFHLVNLAIHIANVLLVLALLRILQAGRAECSDAACLLAVLVFALHPVQTEAVTYLSGRSSSLSTLFCLASLLAYERGRQDTDNRLAAAASLLLFAAAVLVKESALILPLLIALWELARRRATARVSMAPLMPHAALAALLLAFVLLHPVYRGLFAVSYARIPVTENVAGQLYGFAYLAKQVFWPTALTIDPDLTHARQFSVMTLLGGLGLAIVTAAGAVAMVCRPALGLGLLWIVVAMLPPYFVPRLDIVNDRQLYLPLVGLTFVLGSAARIRLYAASRTGLVISAAVIFALGSATHIRNRVYSSELALWEDAASKAPDKPRVLNNLGHAYLQAGRLEEAEAVIVRALMLKPDYALARQNLELAEIARQRNQSPEEVANVE